MTAVDPATTHGRRVTLLLIEQQDDGEFRSFDCIADWNGRTLVLRRCSDAAEFEVEAEWFERISAVDDEARELFPNAEFLLPLIIGELPDGDATGMRRTGWNWGD